MSKVNNILLVVDDFFPHSTKIAAKMMWDLASELQRNGHNVKVVTPSEEIKENAIEKDVDGVSVLFFKSGTIKNTGKVKRAINELLLPYRASLYLKDYLSQFKVDTVVYYSPSIFWGPLVKKIKKQYNAKSYLILRDIFPQWVVDNGMVKKGSLIHRFFSYHEHVNYTVADAIGVMSPKNLEWFMESNVKGKERFHVLRNWTSKMDLPATSNFRKELNLENKLVFFYGGNMGTAQHMTNLVNLAIHFKYREDLHFLFVGKGDEVDLIAELQDKYSLSNLTLLPAVPQQIYFQMLNEFDIGMFSLHPNHKTHNFPGKLLGYMEFAKPIVGFVNNGNDLKDLINDNNAGLVVEKSDAMQLIAKIEELIKDDRQVSEMSLRSLKLYEDYFTTTAAADHIIDVIGKL